MRAELGSEAARDQNKGDESRYAPDEYSLLASPTSFMLHVTPVGFEPTQLALVELESTPLDHSGKVSMRRANICLLQLKTGKSLCVALLSN